MKQLTVPIFVFILAISPIVAGTRVDFDGDGFADLAVGVPGEDTILTFSTSTLDSGAVNTLYGSVDRIETHDNKAWTAATLGVPGLTYDRQEFGSAVAGGDFDGDGFSDLVVGVPISRSAPVVGMASITVLYGTASGLRTNGATRIFSQDNGVAGGGEFGDLFGEALAVGDFDADGYSDVAVGSPGRDVGAASNAGIVQILYGTPSGLGVARSQSFNQDTVGIVDISESGDEFGATLASGDFDGDGVSDLAIGVPREDVIAGIKSLATHTDAGIVHVLFGVRFSGIRTSGSRLLRQGSPLPSTINGGDATGSALAAGDLNGDGFADLAIGIPNDAVTAVSEAGSVVVAFGDAAGLLNTTQLISQDTPGALDGAETADHFGAALAIGNFDGDAFADLAVGAPQEDGASAFDDGAVNVFYGGPLNVTTIDNQLWTQDSSGIIDPAESGDRFGSALSAGDFDGNGRDDLVIGVPFEDVGGHDEGAVNIIYGTASGLESTGNQFWSRESTFVDGLAQSSDKFGSSVR